MPAELRCACGPMPEVMVVVVRVCVCVCARVRARMRARMRACMRVCGRVRVYLQFVDKFHIFNIDTLTL